MFNASSPSLSDIAAATRGNSADGWGNGNGWWVLIILFALFGGWGGNGYGNGGNNAMANYSTQADIQRGFDTQTVISKLDGLNSGVCSLGYDQLAQMNGINQNVMQTGYNIQSAIQQGQINNMQNANTLESAINNCCCNTREAIAQVRYDMSTDTCAVTNAINQVGQNIMQNCNDNYRHLHDEFVNFQIEAKNDTIRKQENQIAALNLSASQCAQNQYLISQIRPQSVPAYIMPNPNTGLYGFPGQFQNNQNSCCGNCA
jgi:hypothetical protein